MFVFLMKNKSVGVLVMGIAVVMAVIVFIFNSALRDIVSQTCSHGPSCAMYGTISSQTYLTLAIVALVFAIGLFLFFAKESERIIFKKVNVSSQKRKHIDYSKLDKEEKVIVKAVEESQGTIFQSDLVEKSQFDKVKVSRILDRLEGRGLIERKRRGMTNVVVLK